MLSEREKRVCEVETRKRKENDTRQEKSDLDKERVVVKQMGVRRKTRIKSWKMELMDKKRLLS